MPSQLLRHVLKHYNMLSNPTVTLVTVAATRLKVGLEAEVGHMMGPVTLQFLMEKPVDSVTTRLKVGT